MILPRRHEIQMLFIIVWSFTVPPKVDLEMMISYKNLLSRCFSERRYMIKMGWKVNDSLKSVKKLG